LIEKSEEALNLDKELKQTSDYVRECEARITKGEMMELQGLDKTVIDMCDRISNIPSEEAKELEEKMALLIKALETLANTIKEYQETHEES